MALFGEKYGDRVRMVEVPGFSLELCGGTHLRHTSQVGLFKIISEGGVAAGVRRIEAVTGRGALDYLNRREATLAQVAGLLKTSPNDVLAATERLLTQRQELEKQVKQLKAGGGATQAAELKPQDVAGIPVIVHALDDADPETVANLADRVAQQYPSVVAVFGTVHDAKVHFAAKVSKDLTAQGLHAGNLVREIAKIAGGGGGGRPEFATAGGRDPGKLQEALDAVPRLVAEQSKR
jgi:alanyl-tRNA synthetase